MVRAVAINADDFGLLPETNRAVIRAYRAGSVTSATMFAAAPASEEAAMLSLREGLSVGLHFDLTSGTPVSPASEIRSLVGPDGRFVRRSALLARSLTGRLRAREVMAELERQMARLAAMGIVPSHLDGHQHVQVLPVVAECCTTFARERGIAVRVPWTPIRRAMGLRRVMKRIPLALLCARASRSGMPSLFDDFASVFDHGPPRAIDPEIYARMITASSGELLEIMVHPSEPTEALRAIHPELYATAIQEGEILSDPRTSDAIRATGVELISYRDARVRTG